MLEVVFVPHRQVVGLLLCISVGWAPSPFELAFGDEFYPSPFINKNMNIKQGDELSRGRGEGEETEEF